MNRFVTSISAIVFTALLSAGYSVAATNEISEEQLADIKASCEAESRQATYPGEYLEQCVEENIQALKEIMDEQNRDAS